MIPCHRTIGRAAALLLAGALLPAQAQQAGEARTSPAVSQQKAAQEKGKAPQENFGAEVELPARTLLFRTVKTSWDEAWPNIADAFKALHADAARLQLKVNGAPLVIYRTTSDEGFEFDAALPIEAAPAAAPGGDLHVGPSRTGKALKFPYRGAFDAMDSTYELISNYIDEKKFNAEDLSIEEYATDPATAQPGDISINIYMPLKP